MGLLKEFREFALKGNVLDLAVGVIIGVEFGKIVNSIIKDLIMPVVGMAGNVDFSERYIPLGQASRAAAEKFAAANNGAILNLAKAQEAGPVFAYGSFITAVINFTILAFCIFMVVKAFNTARKKFEKEKAPPPPAGPTPDQKLLTEIRDLLAAKR